MTKKSIIFLFYFFEIKTMLTKHKVTKVLSLDCKKTPVYFNWNLGTVSVNCRLQTRVKMQTEVIT